MHLEAIRAVAHARFRKGDLDEALACCEEIVRLTEGKEPRICRLQLGWTHVGVLLAMGRPDEARAVLAAYADIVATCQSRHFTSQVDRLKAEIEARGSAPGASRRPPECMGPKPRRGAPRELIQARGRLVRPIPGGRA